MNKFLAHLNEAFALQIQQLNHIIHEALEEQEPIIKDIAYYVLSSRGKMLRAILILITIQTFEKKKSLEAIKKDSKDLYLSSEQNSLHLAAAIELIHLATLVHDDVIDGSLIRRHCSTANSIWNNSLSILTGDLFFTIAFKLLMKTRSFSALEIISDACQKLISGEARQLANSSHIINIAEYEKIIGLKTGALFSAACAMGVINYIERSDEIEYGSDHDETKKNLQIKVKLEELGQTIGIIFQLKDDIVDYFDSNTGKEIGMDFTEAKATLPLILLWQSISEEQKKTLDNLFKKDNRTKEEFLVIKKLMDQYAILDQCKKYLEAWFEKLKILLKGLNLSLAESANWLLILNFLESGL